MRKSLSLLTVLFTLAFVTAVPAARRAKTSPPPLAPASPPAATKCGKERQVVKVGHDDGAADVDVDIADVTNTTVDRMRSWKSFYPNVNTFAPDEFDAKRVAPHEATLYGVNATLVAYKRETVDSDYHLVLKDKHGHTIIAEIVHPDCAAGSPWEDAIKDVRREFDTRYGKPTTKFKNVSIPVRIIGVGFFDRVHDQRGVVEKNGVEIHPILKFLVLK